MASEMSHETYYTLLIFFEQYFPSPLSSAGDGDRYFAVTLNYSHLILPAQQTIWLASDPIILPVGEFLAHGPGTIRRVLAGVGLTLPDGAIHSFAPELARFSSLFSANYVSLAAAGRVIPIRVAVSAVTTPAGSEYDVPIRVTVSAVTTPAGPEYDVERAVRESKAAATILTVPATESSIEALEIVKSSDENEGRCSVCLEDFDGASVGDEIVQTPCSHVYHRDCIVQWLQKSHLCPLCRYAMPSSP